MTAMNTTPITISRSAIKRQDISDEDGDMSYLGEYSNSPNSPVAINRQERGDMQRGEFQYFNPAMTGEETGNPNSPEQDYQRAEAYNRGEWSFIGIRATVTIPVNGISQKFTSAGLWGIESDSGEDYLSEIFTEQRDELESILTTIGITVIDD